MLKLETLYGRYAIVVKIIEIDIGLVTYWTVNRGHKFSLRCMFIGSTSLA